MTAGFPKTDLPPNALPHDFDLYLQSEGVFDQTHTITEQGSYLFAVTHRALELGASTLDVGSIEAAISEGAAAYEIVAGAVDPTKAYDSTDDKMKVFYGSKRFLDDITSKEDFLHKLQVADERMADDTPKLHEVITDIVSPRLRYDPISTRFAVRGAATIRAMQLYIDNRLKVIN